jgi:hypothetical protein
MHQCRRAGVRKPPGKEVGDPISGRYGDLAGAEAAKVRESGVGGNGWGEAVPAMRR